MTKADWSNYKFVKLFDVCDIERAKNGKVYPAGSTLLPLSGMISTPIGYLEEAGEVETKYAVAVPKTGNVPLYIHEVILKTWEEFKARYKTTINIQVEALKFYQVPVHSYELQKAAAKLFKALVEAEREERARLEHANNLKKNMLSKCFV